MIETNMRIESCLRIRIKQKERNSTYFVVKNKVSFKLLSISCCHTHVKERIVSCVGVIAQVVKFGSCEWLRHTFIIPITDIKCDLYLLSHEVISLTKWWMNEVNMYSSTWFVHSFVHSCTCFCSENNSIYLSLPGAKSFKICTPSLQLSWVWVTLLSLDWPRHGNDFRPK